MDTNISELIPQNVKLRKHLGEDFSFAYPDGLKFAEFTRDDGSVSRRLVYMHEEQVIRIDIDRLAGDLSASERAESLFQSVSDQPENIPPTLLKVNELEIWRTRHLFIEGGRDMRLASTAFVQVHGHLYRFQYYEHPDIFGKGSWVLEVLLMTLRPELRAA